MPVNRLVFNYPCDVLPTPKSNQLVVDGRTFYGRIDLGFRTYLERRVQLIGVDIPETRQGASPEDVAKFDRARQCLALAFYGEKVLTEDAVKDPRSVPGRRIILGPMRPNEHGRVVTRAYLQVARNNIMYSNLCNTVAGYSFLDVNGFINFCGNWGWDLTKAKEIHDGFDVMDLTVG